MGKRSDFDRRKNDTYDTPAGAVFPLLRHLPPRSRFGAGHTCVGAFDIEPRRKDIALNDARGIANVKADFFITNPPWTRAILHPIIANLAAQLPTWLLFDADWMHTRQAAPYLPLLRKVVSVGRVKWIPDSPHTGKDNCCWYLFDANSDAAAEFVGRLAA